MREDIRERFFTPFLLPVAIIGGMLLLGVSLSRVLLAVSELGAAMVALLVAGYITAVAFFVQARRRIPGRTLGVALAVGLIGVVAAGAVASAAGMRPLEEESAGEGEHAGGEGGAAEGGNEPLFVAVDIEYEQAPEALPPGDVELTLENHGSIVHNVVLEELGNEKVLEAEGGQSDQATVALEPGEYTYYCDIPGHRATMEGTLTVEEGAAGAEESGGGETEASSEAAGSSEAASEGAGSSEGASEPAAATESER